MSGSITGEKFVTCVLAAASIFVEKSVGIVIIFLQPGSALGTARFFLL
jgi:hypothetical protein